MECLLSHAGYWIRFHRHEGSRERHYYSARSSQRKVSHRWKARCSVIRIRRLAFAASSRDGSRHCVFHEYSLASSNVHGFHAFWSGSAAQHRSRVVAVLASRISGRTAHATGGLPQILRRPRNRTYGVGDISDGSTVTPTRYLIRRCSYPLGALILPSLYENTFIPSYARAHRRRLILVSLGP
ncbi:MAG: hypothetical protein V7609_1048 [Verrucomicrobiota bacterium]